MLKSKNEEFSIKTILECSRLGTWEWNIQTGETCFNKRWAEIVGYSLDELSPVSIKTWENLAHPDDIKASNELLESHFLGEQPFYDFEYRMKHKSGHWVWVRDRGKVVSWTDDGKPVLMFGSHEEITDYKIIQTHLEDAHSFLETVLDRSPFPMWIGDSNGTLIRTNRALREALNLTDEQLIGYYNPLQDPNVVREGLTETIQAVIEQHKPARFKMLWRPVEFDSEGYKEGQDRYVDLAMYPIVRDGKLENIVTQWADITELVKAEQNLATERERLSVTLESIGDGVITTDINGKIVMLNKTAQELTGWSSTDAKGRKLTEVFNIINEFTLKQCENPVARVLKTGRTVELANHTILLTRDNRKITIADSAAPIKTTEDKAIGVVLVFRDMTERKKLERAVEVSSKLESLGVLAGGIAHDFNNLLVSIYGNVDLALESAGDTTTSDYLYDTISTLERARALTLQLLTFAKGGAPVQEIAPLFPFVQETARFALSGSNVSCDFNFQQNLWNCNYDGNQIGQVIDNLIINAQQAMPVGGIINISACNISFADKEHPLLAKGDYVKLVIRDNGIGIPKELLDKIFDPFFTTKTKGHGLGLATCYSIINRHGGCIEVYSEPGNGSAFSVYLPAADASATIIKKQSSVQHTGSGTFLVMDDEEVIRSILKKMLESFGYSVICKANGKDALNYLFVESEANRPVSGIIFDLTVPGGMGGIEAIAELRKVDVKTPVFVASGYSDVPVMKNPVEYGFTACLRKPFRRVELMEMLEKHIKHKT